MFEVNATYAHTAASGKSSGLFLERSVINIHEDPESWVHSIDRREKIGSRHHTVPAFYLKRWTSEEGIVRVYSRDNGKFSLRNVKDLGIKDFYTFENTDGQLDSRFESILAYVEDEAATILKGLLSSFLPVTKLSPEEVATLANFVAFQIARGPRRRREGELMTEWWARTMLSGEVSESDLLSIGFASHQNEHIFGISGNAQAMLEHIIPRPICLLTLDRPLLFTSDEPVIVNVGGDHDRHHADCELTEAQIEARKAKELRKKPRLRKEASRVIHFAPTQPRGVVSAIEIVVPLSPRTALVYGPPEGWDGAITRDRFEGAEASDFAAKVNEQMIKYALDIVIAHPADDDFVNMSMPELEPIMSVCDGTNAASQGVNRAPVPLRPNRLRYPW